MGDPYTSFKTYEQIYEHDRNRARELHVCMKWELPKTKKVQLYVKLLDIRRHKKYRRVGP